MRRTLSAVVLLAASMACTRTGGTVTPSPEQKPPASELGTTPQGETFGDFNQRLQDYAALHQKLEATLPPLPKETNPTVMDRHQRALEALLKQHRKGAKQGDLFTPSVEAYIRERLQQLFRGPDGAKLRATIMDENVADVKLVVNSRYPDQVPLSTMPPQVLAMLPKLPVDLEYWFIGDRLILLDIHAHVVADYLPKALP